ncbi:MAG TPA: hypothetical protein VMM18_03185 [Gemmatimonadaceae bacterium]|nr:hypothetical protein [Gemmatimonadaceae bacterium]
MHEHHLTVARTARYHTLGPESSPKQVWFLLHGYAQLAGRFLRYCAALDDGSRLLIAPEGLSRFYLEPGLHGADSRVGATWMTREDRLSEINDYVGWLDALYEHVFRTIDRDVTDVRVLAFSQATATACRWLVNGKARPDRLYLWGGFLPPDLPWPAGAETMRRLRLTVALGRDDAYATTERRRELTTTAAEHGFPVRIVEYDGGHRIEGDALRSLAAE